MARRFEEEEDEERGAPEVVPDRHYHRLSEAQRKSASLLDLPEVRVWDPTVVRIDEDMLRKRKVYLFEEINAAVAKTVIQSLHWLEDANTKRRITMELSSPGGDVFPSLAIYDTVRSLKPEVTVVAKGHAFSGASLILQAGDIRLLGPASWLMIHEPWESGVEGSATKLGDEAALMKRIAEQMLNIYSSRSRMPRKKIAENWKRKDFYLTADEALQWGFIDGILPQHPLPARRARR